LQHGDDGRSVVVVGIAKRLQIVEAQHNRQRSDRKQSDAVQPAVAERAQRLCRFGTSQHFAGKGRHLNHPIAHVK
jgi:hypothetical protein